MTKGKNQPVTSGTTKQNKTKQNKTKHNTTHQFQFTFINFNTSTNKLAAIHHAKTT